MITGGEDLKIVKHPNELVHAILRARTLNMFNPTHYSFSTVASSVASPKYYTNFISLKKILTRRVTGTL